MYVYDEANNLAKAIQESKEYKEYNEKWGKYPYKIDVVLDVGKKIDVYNQVMLNFDAFVEYVLNFKGYCNGEDL